ncbi:MAG TPA: prolyl oligopeptidase family serine peptidase [Terriglobales bacterium]
MNPLFSLSRLFKVFLFILIPVSSSIALSQTAGVPAPPSSAAEDTKETIHGVVVSDPYQWLEDSASPRTRQWIKEQQQYTDSLLRRRPELPGLRKDVFAFTNIEVPQRAIYRGGYYYIQKKMPGHDVPSLYLRDEKTGKEELLIDPASWSPDHSDTIDLLNVSKDGKLVAYAVRHGGRDQVSIRFFAMEKRRDLPDTLPEARYIYWSLPLASDNTAFFYIKIDGGPRLYKHRFGTKIESDQLVFGSDLGPEMIMLADVSEDGDTLLINVLHGASGGMDLYIKDLRNDTPIKPVVHGIDAHFMAQVEGGHLYILTNWKAPRGRIVVADNERPEVENWRTIIPESEDAIETFDAVGGKLLLNYMKDAHSELRIFDTNGKPDGTIPLPGLGSATTIDGEWGSPTVCFLYSSFQTPPTEFSYSLRTGRTTTVSSANISRELADVRVEQVWYTSKDGTRIPMFLAYGKQVAKNGDAPVLLYGYGGFNWSQTPTFSPEVAVWLKRGGIYAVANIRGGSEFGEEWHKAGSGAHKQNTFDDFIAAAQWLVDNHYTKPNRLAIQGLSNGGLLVTASITQRPDLFGAAVGQYPLIDMVRYERFSIARWWVPEYGSVDDPEQFKTLYSYSPYHHARQGTKYPAVLLITGDGDTRVDPSHARKMTARLQSATTSGKPVLLLYDSKSGHSGTLPTEAEVEQTSLELTFLLWALGMTQ